MSRPRVLIFSTAYFPHVGGAEVAVKEITDRLSDYDFEIITAKLEPGLAAREKMGNILVRRVGLGWRFDKYWLALVGGLFGSLLHKNRNYDLIWGIMASFGGFAALSFKKRNQKVPFLLTLQEGDDLAEIPQKTGFFFGLWRQIFVQADHIQAISSVLSEWARAIGARCPIEIVPNGVDLSRFNFREKLLPLAGQPVSIITTSRLVYKNGIDTLIEALSFLPENFTLKICGEGKEKNNLQALVQKLGLQRRVDFVGSVVSSNLPNILSEADIFCRASRSEGLGNSFLEAMAVGLPVVATPVGGIVDFIGSGETGWFAEPNHPKTIALAIKEITDPANIQQTRRVILNARSLVEKRYDWLPIVTKMDRILTSLCQTKSPKS